MPHRPDKPLCKILTVDDEIGIDSFFYEFFTARNYQVFTASDGQEALKLLRKYQPHIVLLDISMRGMDGIEVLKRIKEISPGTSVIMVTGVSNEAIRQEAMKAGADDYITKPLSLEYLDRVVFLKFLDRSIKEIGGE